MVLTFKTTFLVRFSQNFQWYPNLGFHRKGALALVGRFSCSNGKKRPFEKESDLGSA
jgi:hypothetical protein